ncbi:MAG: DNA methyltransferase [Limnochordia bacterium]
MREKSEFFDLAANERGELPVDIYDFILEHKQLQKEIRALIKSEKREKKSNMSLVKPIDKSIKAKGHTPQYRMHRYFARRPYNVFRGLISHYSKKGDIVLDCFCGGGVTVFEGAALERKVVGVDINPLATFITRMQMFNGDITALERLYEEFSLQIKEKYEKWYRVDFGDDSGICEWTEWAYIIRCPECGHEIVLSEENKITNGVYRCPNELCLAKMG